MGDDGDRWPLHFSFLSPSLVVLHLCLVLLPCVVPVFDPNGPFADRSLATCDGYWYITPLTELYPAYAVSLVPPGLAFFHCCFTSPVPVALYYLRDVCVRAALNSHYAAFLIFF